MQKIEAIREWAIEKVLSIIVRDKPMNITDIIRQAKELEKYIIQ